jgi:hypothetical protein
VLTSPPSPFRTGGFGAVPDPFADYASLHIPGTVPDVLRWCEGLVLANGTYRTALDKVAAYFVTELNLKGERIGGDEKKKYKTFAENQLGIYPFVKVVTLDVLTYGNAFVSVLQLVRRSISCKKCGAEYPLLRAAEDPRMQVSFGRDGKFKATCRCGYKGEFTRVDRDGDREEDIRLHRWNPHEIQLVHSVLPGETRYIWKIPQYVRRPLIDPKVDRFFSLANTPWPVVECALANDDLRFEPGYVFHLKEDTLAGVVNLGWGIPRTLTNFRPAWYAQVLHRQNEAIGLDYVVPLRVVTPEPRAGAGQTLASDPLFGADMSALDGQLRAMVDGRRHDPTAWYTFPFPLRYQLMGGEANQLVPKDLIDQAHDTLLNAVGVPVDFYRGTLTTQNTPTGLRLFESSWGYLIWQSARLLQFVFDRVGRIMGWDPVEAGLKKPSHADDINRQMAKLQLAAQRQISQGTGLDAIGLDHDEEQDRMVDEEEATARRAKDLQERLELTDVGDQMAAGAMAPPGAAGAAMGGAGAPAGPAPAGGATAAAAGVPVDPIEAVLANLPPQGSGVEDIQQSATIIAQGLWQLPDSLRHSALVRLKQRDETVWTLAKSQLEAIREDAKRQGAAFAQQAAQQQAQQAGGMGPALTAAGGGAGFPAGGMGM